MQGFVNFAADIGQVIALLIPLLCYLCGGAFLVVSGWGLWHMHQPGSFWERHPWVPFATIFFAGALLSFDKMLTFGNATFGGGPKVGMTSSLTSYTAPTVDTSTLMGATPEATLLNIIIVFIYFFRSYGALIVLLGVFSLKAVMEGRKRGGTGTSVVMIVFGFAVMNVDTIAAAVLTYFA